MKGTYWQPGNKIDYVNNTESVIEANTVINLGSRIGIAGTDIAPGALGSVITEGVFILEKKSSATAISLGAAVYYDGTGIVAAAGENTVPVGWAIKASAANDPDVYVKLDTIPDGVGATSGDITSALANYYTKSEVDALIPADDNNGSP